MSARNTRARSGKQQQQPPPAEKPPTKGKTRGAGSRNATKAVDSAADKAPAKAKPTPKGKAAPSGGAEEQLTAQDAANVDAIDEETARKRALSAATANNEDLNPPRKKRSEKGVAGNVPDVEADSIGKSKPEEDKDDVDAKPKKSRKADSNQPLVPKADSIGKSKPEEDEDDVDAKPKKSCKADSNQPLVPKVDDEQDEDMAEVESDLTVESEDEFAELLSDINIIEASIPAEAAKKKAAAAVETKAVQKRVAGESKKAAKIRELLDKAIIERKRDTAVVPPGHRAKKELLSGTVNASDDEDEDSGEDYQDVEMIGKSAAPEKPAPTAKDKGKGKEVAQPAVAATRAPAATSQASKAPVPSKSTGQPSKPGQSTASKSATSARVNPKANATAGPSRIRVKQEPGSPVKIKQVSSPLDPF
ncbi:unnamed protein product [Peniophora sp. CBMAI 1063]|nr:unnamed protein product [Peniophora sp. CBMAI 1063]